MEHAARSLATIAEWAGGTLRGADPQATVSTLAIDSRKPIPIAALFVALRGPRNDGHQHLRQLAAQGLRYAMVMRSAAVDIPGLALIEVDDTLKALQRVAAAYRATFTYPVVGITGSNGKTVVKEWLYQLLRQEEHVVRSPGSWNSQVGVPLSVWAMEQHHDLGLFEAGISEPGEMGELARIIAPTIGIFTNVGPAHDRHFPDTATKAREKARLFATAHAVVHCADHVEVGEALMATGTWTHAEALSWSRKGGAWLNILHELPAEGVTTVELERGGSTFTVHIPFTDRASVENAMHCIALLLHMGRTTAWIAERITTLDPLAMRLRTVAALGGGTLIDDTYSNDPASLGIALDHLAQQGGTRGRYVVLSDMPEHGGDALHGRVAALLSAAGVDGLLAVGEDMLRHAAAYPPGTEFHANVDALLAQHPQAPGQGAMVLVKGGRTYGMERVVQRWQERSHGTVMEVDHEALRDNLNHLRAVVGKGPRTMAMLKADAYGSGAVELARSYEHERVDHFGVAYVDEGVELRRHGIRTPVLVMNPEPLPFELLHRYGLETEVYDLRSLNDAIAFARTTPDAPPVHLEIDTGMRRLGFAMDQLPELRERLEHAPGLRIASIMTHLAAAEDPAEDAYTRKQLELFASGCAAISEVLDHTPLRHAANTAGALRFPEARLDMVRLGISLHGIGWEGLRPSTTLSTPVAQLRTIAPGDTVGYNRRFHALRATTLAVLPVGYADGLPRSLGNGVGHVLLHGLRAPFAGTICMDMCMVDVTDIPCSVGDTAIILGPGRPVEELAREAGTIPYEILTGISPRVKRVHLRG